MGQSASQQLENQIFELKFSSKQLARQSKAMIKSMKAEKKKCSKAMAAGNNDIARIHAENAIRQKTQSLNFLRLASRLDAIAVKVQGAKNMHLVDKSMKGVSKAIGVTLKSMNLEKTYTGMEKFEKQCEDLDVQLSVMEDAMAISTATAQPEDEVGNLLKEVADEAGLKLDGDLNAVAVPSSQAEEVQENDLDEAKLQERFRNLQAND